MGTIPTLGNEKELKRLVKLLEMTASQYDSEALAAARKARNILERHQLTYEALFEELVRSGNPGHERQLHHLQRIILEQRKQIKELSLKTEQAADSKKAFDGTLSKLKEFLVNNVPLRAHEKKLLEKIPNTIQPKTKEAYLLLICAKRHGVAVEGQFLN